MLYRTLFRRWESRPELRPPTAASGASVTIRWLGTAAHVVATARTTVLIDPFLTRPRLSRMASRLVPDEAAIRRWLPPRVDAVLCGHSHYDHLLDAPLCALLTGATLYGSRSTCAFGRAAGVADDRLHAIPAEGASITVGDLTIRFVPSLHGRVLLGRVPFPGEVTTPPRLPARAWQYRMGGAYGLLLRGAGVTVYHNGSADLIDAELDGERADVLLAGLAGRRATRDYLARLVGALRPSWIVPTHHDAFFAPLEEGVHLLPGVDLDGFVAEARALAPAARIVTPDYGEPLTVTA